MDKIIAKCLKNFLIENNSKGTTYYHGGSLNDDLFYHNQIWLCDEPWYAYLYACEHNDPVIWKIVVDESNLNIVCLDDLSDDFDPYLGIDDDTRQYFDRENIDGYEWPINYEDNTIACLVLKNDKCILSATQMSENEYYNIQQHLDDYIYN